MRRTVIAVLVLWSSIAAAAPTFEILDRDTAIEVVAHDIKAARTAITPTRQRLEVELAGMPMGPGLTPPSGGVVKVIEFDGSETRRLSIKLNFERPDVKILAKYAQAIQVGNDLHVMFPKTVPAEGASVVLPDPTVPPELAQKLVVGPPPNPNPPPPPAPAPKAEPKPEQALAAKTEAKPEPKADPKPELKLDAPAPAPAPAITTAPPSDDTWSKLATYGALGLGALGCGVWILRKKRAQLGPVTSIDVIAQRSLGAKAKVVWLSAGGREMVVAITPQNVRMLSQWDKQEPLPRAQTVPPAESQQPPSEAVAGILRLRARTNAPFHDAANANTLDAPRPRARTYQPEINEDVATGDEDADNAWAREILAATRGKR